VSGARHHLKIASASGHGHATHVELDGEPADRGLRGLDLRLHVDELNSATLELFAPSIEFDGETEVRLPEETQALLKRLGWTPPEED
jgi:hypothetical protein